MDLDGELRPCVIGSVSDGLLEMKLHADARPAMEIRKAGRDGGRLKFTTRGLLQRLRRKLAVDQLGDLVGAHD
jgi:hypothetical protein